MKALLLPSQVSSPSTPSLPSLSLYLRGPCVSSQSPRFRAHIGIHIHNPLPLCRLFFPPPIRLTGAQAHAKMRFSHCGRTCVRVTFPFSFLFFFFWQCAGCGCILERKRKDTRRGITTIDDEFPSHPRDHHFWWSLKNFYELLFF